MFNSRWAPHPSTTQEQPHAPAGPEFKRHARPLDYFARDWIKPWGCADRDALIPVSRGSTHTAVVLLCRLDETAPFRPIEMMGRMLRATLKDQVRVIGGKA